MSAQRRLSSRNGRHTPTGTPKSPNSSGFTYPAIRQRGYYSDILGGELKEELGNVAGGPPASRSKIWKTAKVKHMPEVKTFKGPMSSKALSSLLKDQVHGPTTAPITVSDFPKKAWEPKVQLPYQAEPGQVPRKIEIERQKRIFAKQNINSLLEELGVNTSDLMPKGDYNMRGNLTEANSSPFPSFLPLHIFDNTEYDCRNPKEWLELGLIDGKQHPVPGKALLPKDNGENRIEFDWIDVGALDYDMNKQLFLVQVVGTGGLQHNVIPATNGAVENGIVNGDASHEEPKKKNISNQRLSKLGFLGFRFCLLLNAQ